MSIWKSLYGQTSSLCPKPIWGAYSWTSCCVKPFVKLVSLFDVWGILISVCSLLGNWLHNNFSKHFPTTKYQWQANHFCYKEQMTCFHYLYYIAYIAYEWKGEINCRYTSVDRLFTVLAKVAQSVVWYQDKDTRNTSLCSYIFLVLWNLRFVCWLYLKIEFCSWAIGCKWCGILHNNWWTASIKPRLLFSRCRLCFFRTFPFS